MICGYTGYYQPTLCCETAENIVQPEYFRTSFLLLSVTANQAHYRYNIIIFIRFFIFISCGYLFVFTLFCSLLPKLFTMSLLLHKKFLYRCVHIQKSQLNVAPSPLITRQKNSHTQTKLFPLPHRPSLTALLITYTMSPFAVVSLPKEHCAPITSPRHRSV